MSLSQCWADVTVCPSLQVIFSACELGVFDLLLKSQEPLSAQHVAQELSTSVDGMERLLDALVGIEILEVETAKGTGKKEEGGSWDWPDYQMLNVMLITNKPKKSWSKQLCTAAPTWQTSTWPKAAPSLFTTWSSTNPRPSTLCGATWWTPSGWWLQLGEGRTIFYSMFLQIEINRRGPLMEAGRLFSFYISSCLHSKCSGLIFKVLGLNFNPLPHIQPQWVKSSNCWIY